MKIISDEEIIDKLTMDIPDAENVHPAEQAMYCLKAVAQAQLEADIKATENIDPQAEMIGRLIERGWIPPEEAKDMVKITPEEAGHLLLVTEQEIHIFSACPVCYSIIAKLKKIAGEDAD